MGSMSKSAILMLVASLAFAGTCVLATEAAHGRKLHGAKVGTKENPRKYTLNVKAGNSAPDCVSRRVILVNGKFQPALEMTQGEWVEVRPTVEVLPAIYLLAGMTHRSRLV